MADNLILIAKALRKRPTDAEGLLWRYLRSKQLKGLKFRRQEPIGSYIVDFVCFEKRLIIEVDGGQHAIEKDRDSIRDRWLKDEGFKVLRFWNNEVLENINVVVEVIRESLDPPSSPPPTNGGGRRWGIFLFAICILFLSSCASPDLQPREDKPRTIVWPVPPEQPRITFMRNIAEPKDMGIKKSFFRKVVDFIFGEELEPRIIRPYGVFSDGKGKLYITDTGLQVVHVFDLEKKKYSQIFKLPWGRLLNPIGVASDAQGNIYVSDSVINRIFVYSNKGRFSYLIGKEGDFKRVTGIAVSPKNDLLYAVDTAGHKIIVFDLKGNRISEIGKRGGGDGEFNFPTHISIDNEGWLYITDSMNFRVQIFDTEGRFVSKFGRLGNLLGTFSKPKGVSVDRDGHIYVVDGIYDTVQIFDKEGRLLLNFGKSGTEDGDFWLPAGIYVDGKDYIYVADTYNNRVSEFRYLPQPEEEVTEGKEFPVPSSATGVEGK